MKILVIGGGNMGLSFAQSFLKSPIVTPDNMMILEKSPDRSRLISSMNLGSVYSNAEDCLPIAQLIILAIKPQDAEELFHTIASLLHPGQILLSIMAGVRMETIARSLNTDKIVRAMPNLPSQINHGMTVFTSTKGVSHQEVDTVQNLLDTTGKTLFVQDEKLLDAATAISGSGPAYVFYFMDALIQAAVKLGFSEPEAELLTRQTFQGTVQLFDKNEFSCNDWVQKVSSRGGTTEAALREYERKGVGEAIIGGAEAAFRRARELGKE